MMEWGIIVFLALALLVTLCWAFRMKAQQEELRRSDRMKRTFVSSISHEIRTPLKTVGELATMFKQEDLYLSKSDKRNIADQLQYNSNLIGTLFDEVEMFLDDNATGRQVKVEAFSPNALCRRCLEANLSSIYHRQAVKLNFKRELNDEFFVKSDRHVVELILNKLILNACRFTEKGEIVVGCNTSEQIGKLTIFVSDTGVGIPASRLGSLFSWFEAPDDMKDAAELDLSICQKLAGKLGGYIRLDDSQQVGTRILLILPLKP